MTTKHSFMDQAVLLLGAGWLVEPLARRLGRQSHEHQRGQVAQERNQTDKQQPATHCNCCYETIETKVRLVRQLLSEGKTAEQAAEAVHWSCSTMYRYLKSYGAETPADQGQFSHGRGRSHWAEKKKVARKELKFQGYCPAARSPKRH